MEGLGKERSVCRAGDFPWLSQHPEPEASTLLWRLKDCFTAAETTADKQNNYMESRKAVLELKDVPPPPPHRASSSQSSQPFSLAPFPLPHPCLPPQPQLTQGSHQQQQPQNQQEGASPKVSICTHCDYCSTGGKGLSGGGDFVGNSSSTAGVVSLYIAPRSLGTSISQSSISTSGPCSVASSVYQYSSAGPLPCSQPSLFPSSAPLASSLPSLPSVSSVSSLPAPLHGSCLAPSGYYTCGVDCSPSARRSQRSTLGDHSTPTTFTTTTTSAHFCSNPMHLNVERTVCVKGAHYCRECFLKPLNGLASDSDKAWPNIPVPQTAPVPIPICNGCGTSSDGMMHMPSTGLSKIGQKYGSPENGGPENIPPVGVFWDIENCSVPSGRSAGAVVQRIRSRFFQGHREAEFICVCDISKESKAVIQELNNCQVTVAHINATAKNAADDKLRQSLRRFAETHTAPATVVLVSSDVNFASELSDLRHRHGFQVILVHGNHTSSALLQHAHRQVAFQEITADLPPRMLVKAQELGNLEGKSRMGFHQLEKGRAASSSPHSNGETGILEQLSKPGLAGESMYRRRREGFNPRSVTVSPVEQGDKSSGEFQISTPSAFSKLNLHRSFSPLVLSQGSWSSRSASPCISSRSSPVLAAPRSPCLEGPTEPFSEGAEVQVGNLDYRMSRKDLQQTLHDTFSRYGRVKAVELSPHTDYQLKATVQMLSLQQAISAVSGLHRYKIGGKRMQVSLITGGSSKSLAMLSSEIICILQDAPASCLPLFKFTEIYEKKYSRKLAVGDLYRLPEVVTVREQGGSRLVCLLPSSQIRQSPLGSSQSQEGSSSASGSPVVFEELEYHEPVCRQHYAQQDFSEADFDPDSYKIPFVVMSLSTLATEVHSLLQSHEGTLPLLSFPECYAAKFCPLQLGSETMEGGVSLEHLITCVPSITIVTAQNGFKVIKWIHNKPPAPNSEPWIQRCKSPVGNPQLIQFSREIIDLLKSQPSCIMPISKMPFSKFIPTYHHHFGRQCKLSYYGFTKLMELFEAIPDVLMVSKGDLCICIKYTVLLDVTPQLLERFDRLFTAALYQIEVFNTVYRKMVRYSKFFKSELVRILTGPDHGVLALCPSPLGLKWVIESSFSPVMFLHIVLHIVTVGALYKYLINSSSIPSTLNTNFPTNVQNQCQVLECGEEKVLTLTEVERIKALAAQLVKLLRAQRNASLPVGLLLTEYSKTFGYGLRLQDYDASSLPALLTKLCHVVKVVDGSEGREVQLINRKSLRSLTSQLLALLMSQEEEQVTKGLKVEELSQRYLTAHEVALNPCEYGFLSLSELLKSLPYLVELYHEEIDENSKAVNTATGEEWVRLTRLYQFARNIRALLHTYHYNQIFLTEFQGAYNKFTGCSLEPRRYGYASNDELLSAIPQVVWIKGHSHKRIIVLKNDMKARTGSSVPSSPQPGGNTGRLRDDPVSSTNSRAQSPDVDVAAESELLCLTSPVDLLCGPVPSCLPSPQLHPDPVLLQQADLIHFEWKTSPPTEVDEFEVAAAAAVVGGTADPLEEPGSVDESAVTKPPSMMKTPLCDSPSRRAARSRIKLAANFSFTAGL
ncbi:putative meiosis arrest female protein 1 -like [Scophthalmus maximus]|uniref:Meiosis regulator and mRNA stability factor 1 n=1 Tax=Scophthalmus maximus TaxID=52904 RepID=A0A2U9BQ19_SCOMX|nr:putative meiosis arrest female protein 1 -like [Scophthalmus maximus]